LSALDSVARFSATADDYDKYRPQYPDSIFEWISNLAQLSAGARIIDIGCGTGIATRPWAARGARVVGVDPNRHMLAHARAHGGAVYLLARAEALPLADGAAQLATMAQSAHWLVVEPELRRRVLAELARVAAFAVALWNRRADTPLMRHYDDLLHAHTAEYARAPTVDAALAALRASVSGARETACAHAQRVDRAGLVGRAWSSSYVAHGVVDRAAFDAALGELFDRHARDGVVELVYDTVAIGWPTRGSERPR
jgi:ubiquinone/menaquinone biosynthesis C-methylase UbiE